MANVVKLKRGSGSDPSASDMVVGEPVIRTDTAELFFKKDDGSVAKVSGGGGGPDFKYLALRNAANNGAASFPGNDFTLVTSGTTTAITPAAANTLLVSVNGVIQKPNTGTSTSGITGFIVDGSRFKTATNLSAAPDFILYQESGGIGEPSDNTVSEAKLNVSNSPVNGYFLSAQSGNTGGLTWAAPVATSCTGNSATATALATARAINGVNFDGTAAITVTAAAGTLSGNTLNSSVVTSSLTSLGDLSGLTVNGDLSLTGANYNVLWDKSDNALEFADNAKATFGSSADLQLYHSGTNSVIDNNTGDLVLRNNVASDVGGNIIIQAKSGEESAKFTHDGSVELRYDNVKKFETTNLGAKVTGELRLTDHLIMNAADNLRIYLGAGNDLQIYHDGTHSKLVNSTGDLHLASNNAVKILGGSDLAEVQAVFNNDGAVELYFDNVKKLQTDSAGTVFYDDTFLGDNLKANFGASADLQIYHDGGGSYIANSTGILRLQAKAGENSISLNPDGSVELYHDHVHMLSTASDGIQLQGDTKISRHPNGNGAILAVTNAQYAKALFVGGWDGGTNSSGISRIRNSNDNLHIDSGSGGQIYLNAYSVNDIFARRIRPLTDNTFDLGSSSRRWDDVFATNGTIQTSDKTKKNTIVDSDLGLSFINKLKPVSYKFNDGTRTHYGLIAQDIETLLSDISKATTSFAGFIKTDHPDEYYEEAEPNIPDGKKEGDLKSAAHTEYGLRYTEFISPLIKAVQELAAKVEALEAG
nr:hypothetical protein [uncultured Mediterranean phage uvMED]